MPMVASDIVKPQMWAPGIRYDHPLARRLVLAMPLWEGGGFTTADLSGNGNHGSLAAPVSWRASSVGVSPEFYVVGDASCKIESDFILDTSLPFTISWAAKLDAYTDSFPGEWSMYTDKGSAFYIFGSNTSGAYGPLWFGGWVDFMYAVASTAWQAERLTQQFYAITYNGLGNTTMGNYTLYRNGLVEAIAVGGNPGADGPGTTTIGLVSGTTEYDGTVSYLNVYQEEFSARVIEELHGDPWDMYRPRRRTYFIPATQGAGAPESGQPTWKRFGGIRHSALRGNRGGHTW